MLLLLATQFLDDIGMVLGKSFSEVLGCLQLKTFTSMETMTECHKDTKPSKFLIQKKIGLSELDSAILLMNKQLNSKSCILTQ